MQIVSACLARDLPVYELTVNSLRTHLPGAEIHVITRKEDFPKFRQACGRDIHIWDESELVQDMTLTGLREMPYSFFPKGAGWYFQQFLKYAFEQVSNHDEYFLIWDADTVLLKPIELFDSEGKPYYTKADEHHRPYFETFEQLFGVPAAREFSFISQHQIIHKPTLHQMLGEIEARNPDARNWAWAIMQNLRGEGSNLFSEYETYGHYMKLRHPGDFVTRDIKWLRDGTLQAGYPPKVEALHNLADKYTFAAFEAGQSHSRIFLRKLKAFLKLY
jgi:hypothetical protein